MTGNRYLSAPCVVCGDETIMACSDCAIDSGGKVSVHVCTKSACRDRHEQKHQMDPRTGMTLNQFANATAAYRGWKHAKS